MRQPPPGRGIDHSEAIGLGGRLTQCLTDAQLVQRDIGMHQPPSTVQRVNSHIVLSDPPQAATRTDQWPDSAFIV